MTQRRGKKCSRDGFRETISKLIQEIPEPGLMAVINFLELGHRERLSFKDLMRLLQKLIKKLTKLRDMKYGWNFWLMAVT